MAAGRAMASRPLLGGLMSRRAAGGAAGGGSISGGGSNSAGPADQPVTVKQGGEQPTPPKPQEPEPVAQQPEQQTMVQQVSANLSEKPTLQEQAPQPSNPTSPVRPLEGLIDNPPPTAQPQKAPGTDVQEPQMVINQSEEGPPTATPIGDEIGQTPQIPAPFQGDKITQVPPRTIFQAPEANPSKAINTATKVDNSSPGYSTLGMTLPNPSFSYLRR